MITQEIADSLNSRALSAYLRANAGAMDWLSYPGAIQSVEHEGLWYVRLKNEGGIMAVYRIREVNGEPVLKGLKRWPKELES